MDRNDYDEIYEDNEQNSRVHQLNQKQKATQQIKEQVKEQAKQQVKKEVKKQVLKQGGKLLAHVGKLLFTTPVGWIIIAAIIIIVILIAEFAYIYQQLSGRWGKITDLWGHLWSGTASQVSDEDVSVLYYDLLNQGLDFKELGAVGEHSFLGVNQSFIDNPELREEAERKIDQVREKYTVQYYLDTITDADLRPAKVYQPIYNETGESQSLIITNKKDKNGNVVMETKMEAAQRLLSQKLLAVRENDFIESGEYADYNMLNVDEGIGLYLKRYLLAEVETFTARNDFTVAEEGYKGSIFIDGGQEEKSVSEQVVDSAMKFAMGITPITWPLLWYDLTADFVDSFSMVEQSTINGKTEMVIRLNAQRSVVDPINVDGDRVKSETHEYAFVITNYVNDYAMPWQYPFAFHVNTLAPDVGYEVALMAHKYHNLYLQVRPTESGCLKVFSESGSLIEAPYSLITPELYLRQMATWYETVEYDYSTDQHTAWHGEAKDIALNYAEVQAANIHTPESDTVHKSAVMIETITTTTTHSCDEHGREEEDEDRRVYSCSLDAPTDTIREVEREENSCTHVWYTDITDEEGNVIDKDRHEYEHTCTCTTVIVREFEKQILVECDYIYQDNPIVTISDTKSEIEGVDKTGIEAMTELLFPEPEIDIATQTIVNEDQVAKYYRGNILTEGKDGTSKDALVISSSAEAIIKSLCDLYSGNYHNYTNDNMDDIEPYDGSLEDYMTVGLEYNMVRQLIQFFAQNGVVDGSGIVGFDETSSFAIMAQWFISGGSVGITSSGNIATIITGSGREVTSPVTGRIMKDDETGYIYIQTDKLGTIYLNNIELDPSVKLGQSISKGQIIGTTKGNVSYYRTDDAGQEVQELANELKQLQTIQFSDYAWPVPDSGNITSNFGSRTDPITGKVSSHHNGVDIGATEGTPIVAYMAGEIIKAGYDHDGYGYYIIIKHTDKCYTLYGHMSRFARKSGLVEKGDVIGYVGSTGRSTGPHLHFEYRQGPNYGDAINPLTKLKNYSYY